MAAIVARMPQLQPETVACEHAGRCAGCPLIALSYPDQLAAKRQRVSQATAPYDTLRGVTIDAVAPAEPRVGYRTRAKLMVGVDREPSGDPRAVLGLFAGDDHSVVDIPGCRVLSPALLRLTSRLRQLIQAPPAAAADCLVPEGLGGSLSAFDLREVIDDEPGIMVTLVLRSERASSPSALRAAAEAVRDASDSVFGVAVNYREPHSPQVLGRTTQVVWGESCRRDRLGEAYHLATYGSFVQAHRGQAAQIENMIATRLAAMGGSSSPHVLDLYGGSGALSLGLAVRGAFVTLVESFAPAALAAERAAREQACDRFVVRTGDAGQVARELAMERASFDAVITNPPRRGMAPRVRQAVATLNPRVIAYVSCDPDTLARDLDDFVRLGYAASHLFPIDMIPLSDQVEIVAFLEPALAPSPRILYDDDDFYVVETPAHATAPRDAGQLVWSVSNGASGVAIWAKTAVRVAGFGARQLYCALVRGATAEQGSIRGRTRYRRIERAGGHSLLSIAVDGGSTAHLRADLAKIGHPVVGDRRFGHAPTNRHFEEKYTLDRLFLHCARLEFAHLRTGERVVVESALPGELGAVLRRFKLVALDVDKRVMLGSVESSVRTTPRAH